LPNFTKNLLKVTPANGIASIAILTRPEWTWPRTSNENIDLRVEAIQGMERRAESDVLDLYIVAGVDPGGVVTFEAVDHREASVDELLRTEH
jgi:hypothetical protein